MNRRYIVIALLILSISYVLWAGLFSKSINFINQGSSSSSTGTVRQYISDEKDFNSKNTEVITQLTEDIDDLRKKILEKKNNPKKNLTTNSKLQNVPHSHPTEEKTNQNNGNNKNKTEYEDEALSKMIGKEFEDALEKYSINNTIILSISNRAYADMLYNWKCFLDRLELKNYLVVSLEPSLHELLTEIGVNTYLPPALSENLDQGQTHGSRQFQALSKIKSYFVYSALRLGYNVLLSDVDIVILRDPFPYFAALGSQWDLLAQSDSRFSCNQYLQHGVKCYILNSGFYFARSNPRTIKFFKLWAKASQLITDYSEQGVLKGLVRRTDAPICLRTLKRELFPDGSVLDHKASIHGFEYDDRLPDEPKDFATEPFNTFVSDYIPPDRSSSISEQQFNNDLVKSVYIMIKQPTQFWKDDQLQTISALEGKSLNKEETTITEPFMLHANWFKGTGNKKDWLGKRKTWVAMDGFQCNNTDVPTKYLYKFKGATSVKMEEDLARSNLVRLYGQDLAKELLGEE